MLRSYCQRTGRTQAVLDGSIAQIGTQYNLILKAVNCSNGESLTSTESQASDKSHVLDALGKAASEIRNRLGEWLRTQKLDTPLEQATTSSLEALQAYSLGVKATEQNNDDAAAVCLFVPAGCHARPEFRYGLSFARTELRGSWGKRPRVQNMRNAFELRGGVSEREKLAIESEYHSIATGDLEKAQRAFRVWAQTYPRDWLPRNELGVISSILGRYDKALAEYREALILNPGSELVLGNVISGYVALNQLEEARSTADQAKSKSFEFLTLHLNLYVIAFLQNNSADMAKQVAWSTDRPGVEDMLLASEARYGRLFWAA